MKTPRLELYYFDSCPYCQRVLKTISQLSLKITFLDIYQDVTNMEKHTYITGRKTVPCLFIDGQPMHESADIINWLTENEKNLDKTL